MNVLRNPEGGLRRNLALLSLVGATTLSGCENSHSNRLETTANAISRIIWCETDHRAYWTRSSPLIETNFQAHDQESFYQFKAMNLMDSTGKPNFKGAETVVVEKKTHGADQVFRFINSGTKNKPSWSVVASTPNQDPDYVSRQAIADTKEAIEIYESGLPPSQSCAPELSQNS